MRKVKQHSLVLAGLLFSLPAQAVILDPESPKPNVARSKSREKSQMELENERMKKELEAMKRQKEEDELARQKAVEASSAAEKRSRAEPVKNSRPGVITTSSGLQYQVITEGTGASPSAADNVTVHYKGYTSDGKEFDNSYSRGAPATFPLNRVIAGWTEGLQLMKEGGKCRLFIPSNLAYGERGAGSAVAPNSDLIFDVELIKVN